MHLQRLYRTGPRKNQASKVTNVRLVPRCFLTELLIVDSQPNILSAFGSSPARIPPEVETYIQKIFYPEFESNDPETLDPHPGTLQWVTNHQGFCNWLHLEGGLFWIRGKSGSGKTVLMRHLQYLGEIGANRTLSQAFAPETTLYFDVNGARIDRSLNKLLRAVIISILQAWPEDWHHGSLNLPAYDNSTRALTTLLRRFLRVTCSRRSVAFMIDAIDDFEGQDRACIEILEGLTSDSVNNAHQLRICVSGSPSGYLCSTLSKCPQLTLEDHNFDDMRLYAKDKLANLISTSEPEVSEEFVTYLSSIAAGMFRWIVHAIPEFLEAWQTYSSVSGAEYRLRSCPPALRPYYERMLARIPEDKSTQAYRIIRCALSALRPLNLEELRWALTFGSEIHQFILFGRPSYSTSLVEANLSHTVLGDDCELERFIMDSCGGLVEVVRPSMVVRPVHFTVERFLTGGDKLWRERYLRGSWDIESCHYFMMTACINFLRCPEIADIQITFGGEAIRWSGESSIDIRDLRPLTFLPYALSTWFKHFALSTSKTESSINYLKNISYANVEYRDVGGKLKWTNAFSHWYQLYYHLCRPGFNGRLTSLRTFAAYHGFLADLEPPKRLRDSGDCLGCDDLHAAVLGNTTGLLWHLKHRHEDETKPPQRFRYSTPLALAITFQRLNAINFMLSDIEGDSRTAIVEKNVPGAPWLGLETPPVSHIYSHIECYSEGIEPTAEEQKQRKAVTDAEEAVKNAWFALDPIGGFYPPLTFEVRDKMDILSDPGGLGIVIEEQEENKASSSIVDVDVDRENDDASSQTSEETIRDKNIKPYPFHKPMTAARCLSCNDSYRDYVDYVFDNDADWS